MKLQKVSVLMPDGEFYPVWAVSDGVLAIHKACYLDRMDDNRFCQEAGDWSITHVATGLSVSQEPFNCLIPRSKVKEQYNRAKSLTWRGIEIMAMPACELLDLVPTIARAIGRPYSKDDAREWLEIKAIAIDALHCGEATP